MSIQVPTQLVGRELTYLVMVALTTWWPTFIAPFMALVQVVSCGTTWLLERIRAQRMYPNRTRLVEEEFWFSRCDAAYVHESLAILPIRHVEVSWRER